MNNFLSSLSTLGIQGLIGLYFLTNAFRLFSYVPQIVQVYRQNDDVRAISLWTWGMWTASNCTTALYAALVLPQADLLLAALNLGNALGCFTVIAIVVAKRRAYRLRTENAKMATPARFDDETGAALS